MNAMLSYCLGVMIVWACIARTSSAPTYPDFEIDPSPTEHPTNSSIVQTLQIVKVPPKPCPENYQRLNGICRRVYTNTINSSHS